MLGFSALGQTALGQSVAAIVAAAVVAETVRRGRGRELPKTWYLEDDLPPPPEPVYEPEPEPELIDPLLERRLERAAKRIMAEDAALIALQARAEREAVEAAGRAARDRQNKRALALLLSGF